MRGERIFRILGLVDEDLIEEAAPASSPAAFKRRSPRRQALAAAACVTLLCGLGLAWLSTGGLRGFGSSGDGGSPPAESGMAGGGPSAGDAAPFLSYAGPVLPLTLSEGGDGLTAERTLTWDFAAGAGEDGAPRQWGAAVTDGYLLSNPTDRDVTATALYPFTGSFSALGAIRPAIQVNGGSADAELLAGTYAGGFSGVSGQYGPDGSTWNLQPPADWEDYETLLEDGAYLADALAEKPALDRPATVYAFTDFQAPLEDFPAATQAVEFTIDQSRTTVLSYGFNGASWDEETGWRQYSYFVPDGARPDTKLLIVLGDDVGDCVLRGYADGGCDPEERIDGVSCTVTRTETTLDAVLDRLCRDYLAAHTGKTAITPRDSMELLTPAMFRSAAAELLTRYGPLSGAPMDRYSDGRLDELIDEALSLPRVLYLRFDVTVPAGGTAAVEARFWKEPSYDFGGAGTGRAGLQGFDMMTAVGSSLTFTRLTAALVNTESVERQNCGFDPAAGVTAVTLDAAEPHYYLEVRPPEA